eukprot:jgi/Psemu1/3101/gm1.3101_g
MTANNKNKNNNDNNHRHSHSNNGDPATRSYNSRRTANDAYNATNTTRFTTPNMPRVAPSAAITLPDSILAGGEEVIGLARISHYNGSIISSSGSDLTDHMMILNMALAVYLENWRISSATQRLAPSD